MLEDTVKGRGLRGFEIVGNSCVDFTRMLNFDERSVRRNIVGYEQEET